MFVIDTLATNYDTALNASGILANTTKAFPDLIVVPEFDNSDHFIKEAFATRYRHDLSTWVIGIKDSADMMEVKTKYRAST